MSGVNDATSSCCIRCWDCLQSEPTKRSAQIAVWGIGAIGSVLIPVPFLNGALSGSMLFMAGHAMIQHPDSVCMHGRNRQIAAGRTWKHIVAGSAIAGISSGLGLLAFSAKMVRLGIGLYMGGPVAGFAVAYTDRVFRGNYEPIVEQEEPETDEQLEIVIVEPPLVPTESVTQ